MSLKLAGDGLRKPWSSIRVDNVDVDVDLTNSNVDSQLRIREFNVVKVQVTQATSITTSVNCDDVFSAVITTQSATTAAGATDTFTVECNKFSPNQADSVHVCINDYSGTLGTNGIPYLTVGGIAPGSNSFDINITNVHPTNALSGTLKISFLIVGLAF